MVCYAARWRWQRRASMQLASALSNLDPQDFTRV
jgi:hypothetical protein